MKKIAIIKKPYNNLCIGCPFCEGDRIQLSVCTLLGNKQLNYIDEYIDKDCPLKAIPKKLATKSKNNTEYSKGFYDGWNCCIDEILGEE